jgi:superfamily II DNA helicase RecQ
VFATACFGLDVHHSNLRLVMHVGMHCTIFEYDQGAGRAGRDGSPATCQAMFGLVVLCRTCRSTCIPRCRGPSSRSAEILKSMWTTAACADASC